MCDFGFSEEYTLGTAQTSSQCRGTLNYFAPELILSPHGLHDEKIDIWSLGCVAYYLAAVGKSLFDVPPHPATVVSYFDNLTYKDTQFENSELVPFSLETKPLIGFINNFLRLTVRLSPKDRCAAQELQTYIRSIHKCTVNGLPPRNRAFVGRKAELHEIHLGLTQPCLMLLFGKLGMGKSEVALEYAWRYAEKYQSVLWISLSNLEESLASVIDKLGLGNEAGLEGCTAAFTHWVITADSWLLVLDGFRLNVRPTVEAFINRIYGRCSTNGRIILTSISIPEIFRHVPHKEVEIRSLSTIESVSLFNNHLDLNHSFWFSYREHTEQIVGKLEGCPGSIVTAAEHFRTSCSRSGLEIELQLGKDLLRLARFRREVLDVLYDDDYTELSKLFLPQLVLNQLGGACILVEIYNREKAALRLLHHLLFVDPEHVEVKLIGNLRPVTSLNRYIDGVISFTRPEELYDQDECRLIDNEAWEYGFGDLSDGNTSLGSLEEIHRLLKILSDFGLIDMNPIEFSMNKLLQDAILLLVPSDIRIDLWKETRRWIENHLRGCSDMAEAYYILPHLRRCLETSWMESDGTLRPETVEDVLQALM